MWILKWFLNLFRDKEAEAQKRAEAQLNLRMEMEKEFMAMDRIERRKWGKQFKTKIPGSNVPIKSQKSHTFKKGLLDLVRK